MLLAPIVDVAKIPFGQRRLITTAQARPAAFAAERIDRDGDVDIVDQDAIDGEVVWWECEATLASFLPAGRRLPYTSRHWVRIVTNKRLAL